MRKNIKETKKRIIGEEDKGGAGDTHGNTHVPVESHIPRGSSTAKGKETERCPRNKAILSCPHSGLAIKDTESHGVFAQPQV